MDLNRQFDVKKLVNKIYQVIEIDTNDEVYQGTITEVNAWLDMYEKGFVL